MGIVNINSEEKYQYYLRKYPDNMVMYTGPGCPACQVIDPTFRMLADQNLRKIFFVVNCDMVKNHSPYLSQLIALPTFTKNRGGVQLDNFTGADINRLHNMMNL